MKGYLITLYNVDNDDHSVLTLQNSHYSVWVKSIITLYNSSNFKIIKVKRN